MSVGNAPIEIEYDNHRTNLVTATNGCGKSSLMLDSLSFVLYGKPYRNVTKPQLINSINGKQMTVEVHFKVNKTKYKVIRGMKPNIFEIYKNDKLVNQDAASRDYQKVLETSILKMNYRTFTQIVIMGSSGYIPFMRLTPNQRREFIEDVLDIKIFSIMNNLLKQKMKDIENKEKDIDNEMSMIKEKIKMQESFIKTLESEKESRIEELQKKVDATKEEIAVSSSKIERLSLDIDQITDETKDHKKIADKLSNLKSIHKRLNQTIEKHEKDKEFYATTDVCPSCHQKIEDHHRENIIGRSNGKITECESAIEELFNKINEVDQSLNEIEIKQEELSKIQSEIGNYQSSITVATKMIIGFQNEINDLLNNSASVDAEKQRLKTYAKTLIEVDKTKKQLTEDKSYHDVGLNLLKDNGIKTKIVKQYVPVFNKLIEKYLQQLDLFVQFQLDENFNETVKSKYRESFTYDSFSEGEKLRVDLALLFVFRDIARLKSAVNVNILIMDEIMDGSIDSAGIDNFFNIINNLSKTNLFVISHRDGISDKFIHTIKLEKKNNFTIMC
jgi:DNA repair exonuclease SbcCD ATPase subunit